MRAMPHRNATHPIWRIVMVEQGRTLKWLAREVGCTPDHVRHVKAGTHAATDRFRAECARVLGMDESVLFHGGLASPGGRASRSGVPAARLVVAAERGTSTRRGAGAQSAEIPIRGRGRREEV